MAYLSHQRDDRLARTRRLLARVPARARIAAPLAVAATLGVVGVGVVGTDVTTPSAAVSAQAPDIDADRLLAERAEASSRSARRDALAAVEAGVTRNAALEQYAVWRHHAAVLERARGEAAATAAAVAAADTPRWADTDLDLHAASTEGAEVVGLLEEGTEVLVTGRSAHGREEVVWEGASRWVTAGHLATEAPAAAAPAAAGTSETAGTPAVGGTCDNGSSVGSGVTANIVALHEAVCAAFPDITQYGGWRGDGDHGRGLALDIMVSGDRGWEVAEFVRANYSTWDVNNVIYEQQIWSVERSGEGWRSMEDRGSATANHFDHVHVSVY
ncbi:hypothetical protein ACOACO_14275 [Nocardioides sp. CPCC 205120]|uniref:hypothetical protein n=1 Tax=Nocardioides sp. CPCC 205120 TaxID=3406462 RepID=UPI003B5001C2